MKDYYTLGEVSRILGRKPHQIVYPLTTGKVQEPANRIAGKRLFQSGDVERLGRHFRVRPDWNALEPKSADGECDPPAHLTLKPPYEVIQVSETGYEVRDSDGEVFCWSPDRGRGLVLAGLLEAAARG